MKKIFLIVLGIVAVGHMAMAEEVTFNYEGRIKVSGQTYTGPGYFKMAIINNNHQITLWSNDGTSVAGDEPTSAFVTDVTDGVFNIVVGDTSIANMETLNPAVFNADEKVYLRVWFSDVGSDFELMRPDRQITNPALLGRQSQDELVIYVDPSTGSDSYTGLEASRPKQTIQAAWDMIPSLVNSDVFLYLQDGTYRENVYLAGKSIIGEATIAIIGNIESPESVVVTGADAGDEMTPVRDYCFHAYSQKNLSLEGITMKSAKSAALYILSDSEALVKSCRCTNCCFGIWAKSSSDITLVDVSISDPLADGLGFHRDREGLRVDDLSRASVFDSQFAGLDYGAQIMKNSVCVFKYGNTISNNHYGVNSTFGAFFSLDETGPAHLFEYNDYAVCLRFNAIGAYLQYHGIYTENGVDLRKDTGAEEWNFN